MHPTQRSAVKSKSVARWDERTSTIIFAISPQNSHTIFFQISRNLPLLPRSALPAVPGIVLCLNTRYVRPGVRSSGPELYNSRETVLFVAALAGILDAVARGVLDPGTG